MSFLNAITEAFEHQNKPQSPVLGPADRQAAERMKAIEASRLKRQDDTRRASLEHNLADEDRRRLAEKRNALVAGRQKSGKPLNHHELRVFDAEIELILAKKAYDRNPGEPQVLGDGNRTASKQTWRVRRAEDALKKALESVDRVRFMLSPAGVASTHVNAPSSDLRGYFDHKAHVTAVMEALKK